HAGFHELLVAGFFDVMLRSLHHTRRTVTCQDRNASIRQKARVNSGATPNFQHAVAGGEGLLQLAPNCSSLCTTDSRVGEAAVVRIGDGVKWSNIICRRCRHAYASTSAALASKFARASALSASRSARFPLVWPFFRSRSISTSFRSNLSAKL